MFDRILIANRGEIAARVAATARRMGISSVAVYSDADANARHVTLADEAVHIGPAAAAESYLKGERIVEAALRTGAQAIHPGYGFLSENPEFADAVAKAGLVFIGPPASSIRAMGLKDAAKALMEEAGVPVVPGYHGAEQDAAFLAAEAERIGYPVLIKARAGGGGKGMRQVAAPGDFAAALEGAQREAQAAFGDPACLIEKYITTPRHVEIQVFADGHGNVVHLFERDCSLQRRHQKVIEEAPAPGMPADVRAAMGAAAVEAARAVGYQGAGTVEFIADGQRGLRADGFWFMEMNTRLQVEHPVTEAIAGLDLVELQIRVAAGEALPFVQDDLAIGGHAVEARLYAEDAGRGFLPAAGRLDVLSIPDAVEFGPGPVRVDSGVVQGDEISPHYDPMIAKVIAHGPDRPAALRRLAGALDRVQVAGTVTNLDFLRALLRHGDVAAGRLDTGLIGRDQAALTAGAEPDDEVVAFAAIASLGLLDAPRSDDPWDTLRGWRHWSDARLYATLERGGETMQRLVVARGKGAFLVEGGGAPVELSVAADEGGGFRCTIGGHRRRLRLARSGAALTVFAAGQAYGFELPDQLAGPEEGDASGDTVAAPMPGLVKVISADAGHEVRRGDALMVLEAMKMEHTLTAPRDGVIADVLVSAGAQVTDGQVLVRLEEDRA